MVADKGKKLKQSEKEEEVNSDHIDGDLVLSIEKLQEIQDDLEKVISLFLCLVPPENPGKKGRGDLLLLWLPSFYFYGFFLLEHAGFKILIFFFTCIFVGTKRLVSVFVFFFFI